MPDYQSNSKKRKDGEALPPKVIEQVVVSKVIVQKKGPVRKFKDLFIEADVRSVSKFVASDILVPAAKNMFLDAWKGAGERLFLGEAAVRRRNYGLGGSRIQYNTPVNRAYSDGSSTRYAPAVSPAPRSARHMQEPLILTTRAEAEIVLERMSDIIEEYEVVSIADLNELIGHPSSHVDYKWGWTRLNEVQIRQVSNGFLIDFPATEPIS